MRDQTLTHIGAVIEEVWTAAYTSEKWGVVLNPVMATGYEHDPPHVWVRDAHPNTGGEFKFTWHALDFTETFYGTERLVKSLDQQLADAARTHAMS